MTDSKYLPTIGIETHVQLRTKTKLFAAVGNDARKAAPNTLISHICVGMPGALPVLNRQAIKLSARAAFALNTKPQAFSKFERKHYFYPDLPKGYQITQYEDPIIFGGYVDILVDGQSRRIRVERANLEEDAGKNIHPPGADYSLVDLNRAGTPLLEIVSYPDIHSPAEAKAYARELYLLMKYVGVTEGDLYHGHMRFDLNISVSKEKDKLGTRSEVKNLNSFRAVEAAVAYEIDRQIELLDRGGKVVQETRGWDEAKQKTTTQRIKEEAHDYRYMPEPDIPPVECGAAEIDKIKKALPKLPSEIRSQLSKLGIGPKVIEDILDRPAAVRHCLEVLEHATPADARRVAFWYLQAEPDMLEHPEAEEIEVDNRRLIELSKMVEAGDLSSTAARRIFSELVRTSDSPRAVAKRLKLLQVSDVAELEKIVATVIAQNPKPAQDVRRGEFKAIGFLVGLVMAKSKGQANPQLAQELIKKQLNSGVK